MLEVSLAALLRNISDVLNAARCHPKGTTQLALSKSTGGRPAYNITKEMIEQLGETGMNCTSMATCLGISDQTLYRRRIEFGVENNFTEITNEELDRQIQETLNLTPYSGEIYVRGSLKGRGINVQRFRIRESLNRIDGIGRAVRRRYSICRRTYNVAGLTSLLWTDIKISMSTRGGIVSPNASIIVHSTWTVYPTIYPVQAFSDSEPLNIHTPAFETTSNIDFPTVWCQIKSLLYLPV